MRRLDVKAGTMALVLALSGGQAFAGYAAGKTAYQSGDFATALAEWKAGARQGEGLSLFGLGRLYQSGQGVAADPVQAHVYYNIASALGVREAGPARDSLGKLMSPENLAAAQREAQELMSSRRFVDSGPEAPAGGQMPPTPAPQTPAPQTRAPPTPAAPAQPVAPAPSALPRVRLGKACQHVLTWQDRGSGGARDVSLYDPEPAAGEFVVGGYVQGNYSQPSGCVTTIAEASPEGAPRALAEPAGWQVVWEDRGTGANMDGSIWAAVPPSDDYVCLGDVGQTGYSRPRPPPYACVHRCLVREVAPGAAVWTDQATGARTPVAIYAPPGLGTFVAYAGGDVPQSLPALDPSAAACGGR
jgi:hypothetical protein